MITKFVWTILRLVALVGLVLGVVQIPLSPAQPRTGRRVRTARRANVEAKVNLAKRRGWFVVISENWADALDPIVRKWIEQGYQRRPSLIDMLFNVQSSSRAYEEASSIGAVGIDSWNQWENAGAVAQADFDQGYKKTYTHREYPLELQIQRKFLDDNNFRAITDPSLRLGDSAALKREVDAASVFNNAFSGSFLGADGVALCSDSHPYGPQKTGSTQDNNFALALTKDNVASVREAMMAFTDDNGNKVAVTPTMILVPPTLEDEAIEITQSLLDPNTANNTVNPQAGRFQVVTWHYLTDTNAWFMIDPMLGKMSLDWFNRQPLTVTPKVEDKTLVATWIAYMRYSFGWSDWRWIAGSNPS
jgi:phage major head subunit gpT-like protein